MVDTDNIVMFAGQYDTIETAKDDFALVGEARRQKFIGWYEAAVFTKTAEGKVQVIDTEAASRGWGAKAGLVTGAVLGLVFPPSVLVMAATGAGVGAGVGNIARLLSKADIKEVGDLLEEGQSGVILMAEVTAERGLEHVLKNAAKTIKREIDLKAAELKAAVDEAVDTALE